VVSGRTRLPAVAEQVAIAKEEARERRRDFGDRRPFFVDAARYIASLQRERPRRRAIAA
jgi:hypothetical protein